MFIKLLCFKTCNFSHPLSGDTHFTIKEGETVNAIIGRHGISIEYEEDHYSVPYRFEDIEKSFISAFDEESYNGIYKKGSDCRMYFEDGSYVSLGTVTIKMEV